MSDDNATLPADNIVGDQDDSSPSVGDLDLELAESNVVSLMENNVDVIRDIRALCDKLSAEDSNFKPNRAVLTLLDETDQIGLFGYGRLANAHQTVGILEHAKATILNPQPNYTSIPPSSTEG